MEENSPRDFLNDSKYRGLRVGFIVGCVHFVTAYYFMTVAEYPSTGHRISQILTIPSYLLSMIATYFLWFYTSLGVILVDWQSYTFPYTLPSSLFCGFVAGFLSSGKRGGLFAGIVLILFCIFCLAAIYLMAMIGQLNA